MHEFVGESDGILRVRIHGTVTAEDARALGTLVHAHLDAKGSGVRMLVDARGLQIYSPDGADVLLEFMKRANPKLDRAAFLAPASRTASLQLTRLIREAGSNNRRVFEDEDEALRWLAPAERRT